MKYYYDIKVKDSFGKTKERLIEALSNEGFGILSEIDLKATFKKKLGIEFRDYVILGTCNPSFSIKAVEAEDKIGTLLPCNVIIQDTGRAYTEVAAVDPVESMKMVDNAEVAGIAEMIRNRLIKALDSI